MVRNIAGTLLAIGAGQLPLGDVPKILKAENRKSAWDTAPAEGLCLMKVKY
jgi:tRNA pseudouridine38-40 synthase